MIRSNDNDEQNVIRNRQTILDIRWSLREILLAVSGFVTPGYVFLKDAIPKTPPAVTDTVIRDAKGKALSDVVADLQSDLSDLKHQNSELKRRVNKLESVQDDTQDDTPTEPPITPAKRKKK